MTRRTAGDSTESLELLLDTICNTFGAVIFISMLVAVLVGQTARSQPTAQSETDPVADAATVQADILAAQEKLRVLTSQMRQQELVKERFASEESRQLAGRIQQQTEARVRLMEQKSDAVQEVTQTNSQNALMQQQLEQHRAEYDATQRRNQELREELKRLQELSSRTARIPQVRKTTKDSVVYAIDDGRLFRVTTPDLAVDRNDCDVNREDGVNVVRPKPGAGVPIPTDAAAANSSGTVRDHFKGANPKTQFIQLFVSRDSFAEFLTVKDTMVELGIEYEVLITEDDTVKLSIGSSSRESFVQ
ncbi:MAG: hypothetical protein R3C49_05365 [Planctomycetaceae bacterium]